RGKKRIRKERSICLATQWDRNLERNNRVYFYLSDEELSKLNDRLEYYNSNNRSEFIRNSVLNNYIIINDDTNLRELVYEVNRIGNNINQLKKLANQNKEIQSEEIDELKKQVEEIRTLVFQSLMKHNEKR